MVRKFDLFADVHTFFRFRIHVAGDVYTFCQNGISMSFRPRAVGTVKGAGDVAGNWVEKGSSDLS